MKDVASILQNRIIQQAPEEDILEIGQLLMSLGDSRKHVAEIYNPERFTSKANRFGLKPGFAIDLTLLKEFERRTLGSVETGRQDSPKGATTQRATVVSYRIAAMWAIQPTPKLEQAQKN